MGFQRTDARLSGLNTQRFGASRTCEAETDVLGHVAFEVQDKDRLSLDGKLSAPRQGQRRGLARARRSHHQGLLELRDLRCHEVGRGAPVIVEASDAEPSFEVPGCARRPVGRLYEKARALEFGQTRRAREVHEIEGVGLAQDVACPKASAPDAQESDERTLSQPALKIPLSSTKPVRKGIGLRAGATVAIGRPGRA